ADGRQTPEPVGDHFTAEADLIIKALGFDPEDVPGLQKKIIRHARHAGKPTEDELANLNALRAYEFIDFLSDQPDIPIDELVIRQLNRYFMEGVPPTLTPGTYRKGKNSVGNFNPPDQGDVPDLMRSFALWLRNEDEELNPILKAGIAHLHLVAIHPFWDGNGRTARGLSTLVLQRTGFGFKKLLSLEFHLSAIRDYYFAEIERALGNIFTENYDVTGWLEFFVLAMKLHIDALVSGLTDWHRMMQDLHMSGAEAGLTPRQVDGHMYAVHLGQITRSDYIEVTGVSSLTLRLNTIFDPLSMFHQELAFA
ncbi:MAG: Fic family protein, partial [Chloroflexi bacterium]|nr:Fic family protein [Chloroflexota bacterium]